jgi:SAM-dependent methyltransferase
MPRFNKYELYELAVQSPENQIDTFQLIYWEINKKTAHHFREDFCGTFKMSVEWVKWNTRDTALALDIDPEPLRYGKRNNYLSLSAGEKKRLRVKALNVMSVTDPKVDIIGASNFSFYCLKERKDLLRYFRCCVKSLRKKGVLILEMAGGPGFIDEMREQKAVKSPKGFKYKYVWDQKSFDPVTRHAKYAIHFEFKNGKKMKNAFVYDWRLWTIPEVRDALVEAGFKNTCVYWDKSSSNLSTHYVQVKQGENDPAWIAQIVGIK